MFRILFIVYLVFLVFSGLLGLLRGVTYKFAKDPPAEPNVGFAALFFARGAIDLSVVGTLYWIWQSDIAVPKTLLFTACFVAGTAAFVGKCLENRLQGRTALGWILD